MVVSKMLVSVRLHNLPLHFWHHKVLIAIGNTLGKFLKIDEGRLTKGIFTFARICVEVDLSQGLPQSIILNFNNTQWIQSLDYENTTFRCRGCLQIGHLLSACPQARNIPNRNKQQQRRPKGWQHLEPLDEEEDTTDTTEYKAEKDEQKTQRNTQEKEEAPNNPLQQQDPWTIGKETSGNKKTHGSEESESDKESPITITENQLSIVTTTPNSRR